MADGSQGSGSGPPSVATPRTFPKRAMLRFPSPSESPVRGTPALPPEIEFLVQHGVSADRLLHALASKPAGVEPLDTLLAEGIVGEEQYYHALAQHLGCMYYVGEPPFAEHFDAVKSLKCGVAPLAERRSGPRAVIAPRGELVPRLIETRTAGHLHPKSFAVASPHRFAALVRMRRGDDVLADALARIPDSMSARRGMSGAQIATAGLATIAAVVLGVENFHALTGSAFLALWLLFSASIVQRSAAAIAHPEDTRPPLLSDDELPVYTVVVPVYREADVVEDLIRALDAIDYPKSKLDIKLVAERRDDETLSRIVGLDLPARYELVVAPPGEPCTKPRALNIALATARGELIVVYDAEDAPSPSQLRLAASRFAAERRLDCVQARLTIRNPGDSWLSKLFAAEYAVLFDLINPGLCALDLPIALGGTSNHFRVAGLIAAGGWDEWNVAEDADLGIRLARFGCRIGALNSDTSEEAPHEFLNWFRQRVRWQKGWMQTCIVHSRQPTRLLTSLGRVRTLSATLLIFGSVLSALFWPAFALNTVIRALEAGRDKSAWREASDVFTYILALAGIWALAVPAIVATRLRRLDLTAKDFALAPIYYLLVSLASWTAILDLLWRPYHWAKTEHGRTRRRAPCDFADI
jgi:cellulose synthase/poly-beta-1,6-N-acetylglucosamine synthase-like glycosyltransferase